MRKWKNHIFSALVQMRLAFFAFLPGCASLSSVGGDKITSINIIDRSGMAETISSKERLSAFQKTDFLAPQPYQKVMRIYAKDKEGAVRAIITSYHPNGQIKQSLETMNNRALGPYKEWYPSGQKKIEGYVIGGVADINTQAEESWLFDGISRAWDEDGNLLAEIRYDKGELQGESKYFHPNGRVWKILPYEKNAPHGAQKIYLDNGMLLQTTDYVQGVKEGLSVRYWDAKRIAYQELYQKGLLIEAEYLDKEGNSVAEIHEGQGFRAVFGKNELRELHAFKDGVQEGSVRIYDENGILVRSFGIREGEKQGEEIDFYPSKKGNLPHPKLLMTWNGGIMEGPVKTWYENGNLESQKEMSQNKKNGLSTAWYPNGSLMLVEEYDNDQLVKGEYYRMGETQPFSKIERGRGVATLFNAEGNFSKKIVYKDGKPLE